MLRRAEKRKNPTAALASANGRSTKAPAQPPFPAQSGERAPIPRPRTTASCRSPRRPASRFPDLRRRRRHPAASGRKKCCRGFHDIRLKNKSGAAVTSDHLILPSRTSLPCYDCPACPAKRRGIVAGETLRECELRRTAPARRASSRVCRERE